MKIFTVHESASISLGGFMNDFNKKIGQRIVVDETFQRKYVWKENKIKRELIMSILFDRPIGAIMIWSPNESDKNDSNRLNYIIDGQQRIKTIDDFIKNEFSLDSKCIKEILEEEQIVTALNEYSGNQNPDKDDSQKCKFLLDRKFKSLKWENLPNVLKDSINEYQITKTTLRNIDKANIVEYFRVLQNQEKLKAGELLNSLDENSLGFFLTNEQIAHFCGITNFNDNRMGFTKHFAVHLGLICGQMSLGLQDKIILKKIEEENLRNWVSDNKCQSFIEKIKNDLYKEHDHNYIKNQKKLTVLGIKILFLAYSEEFASSTFLNVDLKEKSKIIKKITDVVGYWNSKDETKKEKLFKKIENYCKLKEIHNVDQIKNGIKAIWTISKTTHNLVAIQKYSESIKASIDFFYENQDFEIIV